MLEIYCNILSMLKIFPLDWINAKFLKMAPATTIWQKLGAYMQVFMSCCHVTFLIVRFIPGYGYTREEFKSIHFSMIVHAIELTATGTVFVMQLAAINKGKELADLVNQLLHFNAANGNYKL